MGDRCEVCGKRADTAEITGALLGTRLDACADCWPILCAEAGERGGLVAQGDPATLWVAR